MVGMVTVAAAAAMAVEALVIGSVDASVVRKCHVNGRFSAECPCNGCSAKAALIMAPNRYVWLHYASCRFPYHDRSNYRMCRSSCLACALSRPLNNWFDEQIGFVCICACR